MSLFIERVREGMLDPYPDMFRYEPPVQRYDRISRWVVKPLIAIEDGVFVFRMSENDAERLLHEIGHILYRPPEKYFTRLDIEVVNYNFVRPKGFRGINTAMRNELNPFAIADVLGHHFRMEHSGNLSGRGLTHIKSIEWQMRGWKNFNLPFEYWTEYDRAKLNTEFVFEMLLPFSTIMNRWRDRVEWLRLHREALRLKGA